MAAAHKWTLHPTGNYQDSKCLHCGVEMIVRIIGTIYIKDGKHLKKQPPCKDFPQDPGFPESKNSSGSDYPRQYE